MPSLSRRAVLTLGAGGLAALAAPGYPRARGGAADTPLPPRARGDALPVTLAAVPRGSTPEATARAVRAAALAIDDLAWLSRGDTVLLKVASNSGNPYPATTDPVAVRALAELLGERGARRVIVADMSGVQFVRFWRDGLRGSSRVLMERNGIARAARDAGAELQAFEEAGWDGFFEERPTVSGTWAGPVMLPNILREVDHVVLLPRTSRHLLAGSTLGLKAAVGWWRHDSRLEYHRDAGTFSEKTADANSVPTMLAKQRLVLTSGTQVLATFGPDDGHVLAPAWGLVFASPSVVAHDMTSLAWLLAGRAALPADVRHGPLDDPNESTVFVNVANRVVTAMLGGMGQALRTQHLTRYDLDTVWDDRVLRRAFLQTGGVPALVFTDADGSVPAPLREQLAARVTPPPDSSASQG